MRHTQSTQPRGVAHAEASENSFDNVEVTWATFDRAMLALCEGNPHRARDLLLRAIEFSPHEVGVRVVLGWVYVSQRDLPPARAAFESALLLDPRCAEARGGLAAALVLVGDVQEARAQLRELRDDGLVATAFGAGVADMLLAWREHHASRAARPVRHSIPDLRIGRGVVPVLRELAGRLIASDSVAMSW